MSEQLTDTRSGDRFIFKDELKSKRARVDCASNLSKLRSQSSHESKETNCSSSTTATNSQLNKQNPDIPVSKKDIKLTSTHSSSQFQTTSTSLTTQNIKSSDSDSNIFGNSTIPSDNAVTDKDLVQKCHDHGGQRQQSDTDTNTDNEPEDLVWEHHQKVFEHARPVCWGNQHEGILGETIDTETWGTSMHPSNARIDKHGSFYFKLRQALCRCEDCKVISPNSRVDEDVYILYISVSPPASTLYIKI